MTNKLKDVLQCQHKKNLEAPNALGHFLHSPNAANSLPSLQTQSNDGNAGTNSQQTQPTVEDVFATMQASSAPPNAQQQREWRFGFWVLLSFSVLAAILVSLFLIYLKK
jgi:hypothetical protein